MSKNMEYCPFCDGEDVFLHNDGDCITVGCFVCDYEIKCHDCTEDEALDYWNYRPKVQRLKKKLRKLKKILTEDNE